MQLLGGTPLYIKALIDYLHLSNNGTLANKLSAKSISHWTHWNNNTVQHDIYKTDNNLKIENE